MSACNCVKRSDDISADKILCAALDIGEHILKNGGEIHRVEDTIERICRSFGAEHIEVFTITSLIVASIRMKNGDFSHQMRRIYRTSNNLYMVEEMNSISRELCSGTLDISDLRARILAAKKKKPYNTYIIYLATALAAGGYAVFFGGNIMDGVCAAIAGLSVTFLDRHAPSFVNQTIMVVINSACAGILGIILLRLGIGEHTDKIMMGTVMLLIPGLALGNAVRDMLGGDIISGAVRMIQALITAVMIAFGYAIAMLIMGGTI